MLANLKLNTVEVLTSKVLIDSVISYDEFVLIKNLQKNIVMIRKKKSKILIMNKYVWSNERNNNIKEKFT